MYTDIEELTVWELYFSWKGRLSSRDFGLYGILFPILFCVAVAAISIILVIAFWVVSRADPFTHPLSLIFFLCIGAGFALLMIWIEIITNAKRARDFNHPAWVGIFSILIVEILTLLSNFMQGIQLDAGALETWFSSILYLFIVCLFWFIPQVDKGNLYGPPCKVVWKKNPYLSKSH